MRNISVKRIESTIKELFIRANTVIGDDIREKIAEAKKTETSPVALDVLEQLEQNYDIACSDGIAICQDTGMAVIFMDIGQDVHFADGDFREAVNAGVKAAYKEGYLRKSVVRDPLYDRVNTGDNTPAVLHCNIVSGDRVTITVAPKGFGSENMSKIGMLKPSDGEEGVIRFIRDCVAAAGPNACPPVVVGAAIGGTMEQAAVAAKRALTRPLNVHNPDARYAALEDKILQEINKCGIGPAGLGGRTTALGVQIEVLPTHIAGMPVAVNMCCHAARHAKRVL